MPDFARNIKKIEGNHGTVNTRISQQRRYQLPTRALQDAFIRNLIT